MNVKSSVIYFFCCAVLMLSIGCQSDQKPDKGVEQAPKETNKVEATFNSDSAYAFIEKQLSFGPRVPESKEHAACADWIKKTMTSWDGRYNSKRLRSKDMMDQFRSKILLQAISQMRQNVYFYVLIGTLDVWQIKT